MEAAEISAAASDGSRAVARAFRPDIEGLRAIAVGLVLADHAGLTILSGGYVGVDVFFVLSGFLITGLLIKEIEATGRLSMGRFYGRRARRLLPAGSLVLLTTVIASVWLLGGSRAERVATDARWATLFAANFRFISQGTDYFSAELPPSPLQHYWSLAVEEQFYAVWPMLIIFVARAARRLPLRLKLSALLTVMIPASLWWSYHQTASNGTAAYFSPLTRTWEFGVGAMLAVGADRVAGLPRRIGSLASWTGLIAIGISALVFDASTPFPGLAATIPVMGAALAVAGGTIAPGEGAEWLLKRSAFQWIGRVSYSLYLWHWPVLVIAAGWAGHDLTVTTNIALCGLALVLAAATYVLIESPVRESTYLKRRPPKISLAIGTAIVVLTFGAIAGASRWQAQAGEITSNSSVTAIAADINAVETAVSAATTATDWPPQPQRIVNTANRNGCDTTRKDTTSPMCVHGDPNADRTVVVYGDSHGAMWIPALDLIGKNEQWRIVHLTKPACQVADFPSYSKVLNRECTECSKFRAFALRKIAEIHPDVVILTSAFKGPLVAKDGKPTTDGLDEAWAAGLGSMIDRIAPLAGRVIVLGDMAYPAEPGIDCLTAHPGDVEACDTSVADAVFADHNAAEAKIAAEHGAAYVNTIPWFCTTDLCPAVIAGLTVHRDAFHVAENYVVWLSTVLGEATGLVSH